MQMAHIPDAATNIILQTVFMNGLYEDIRVHVETQGALTIGQKLNRAQGYFRAHSTKRSFANEISPELWKIIGYDEGQHFAREQKTPTAKLPQQIRPEPTVTILPVRTAQPVDGEAVNRLTKEIADLKIYISNSLAPRSNRPTERFGQAA